MIRTVLLKCFLVFSCAIYGAHEQKTNCFTPLELEAVLNMHPKDLGGKPRAQNILFIGAIDFAMSMVRFCKNIMPASMETEFIPSIKGKTPQQMAKLIIQKCTRKRLDEIWRLHDIVRGRCNIKKREGISETMQDLVVLIESNCDSAGLKIVGIKEPIMAHTVTSCCLDGNKPEIKLDSCKYPRLHVDLQKKDHHGNVFGFIFELQIGPKQITDYYEKEGRLTMPNGIDGIKPNLHDVAYKVLKPIFEYIKKYAVSEEEIELLNGLGYFFRIFDNYIMIAGVKVISEEAFNRNLYELHRLAGQSLAKIARIKGTDFILEHRR